MVIFFAWKDARISSTFIEGECDGYDSGESSESDERENTQDEIG
jgi:hypothetical protein